MFLKSKTVRIEFSFHTVFLLSTFEKNVSPENPLGYLVCHGRIPLHLNLSIFTQKRHTCSNQCLLCDFGEDFGTIYA